MRCATRLIRARDGKGSPAVRSGEAGGEHHGEQPGSRGQVLSLKSQQFVLAARALGQSHTKIIVRHLLPNIAGIVIIYLTLTIPAVILDESFLSFLGLGVQAPQASWGSLLSDGAQVINPVKSYWWLLLFPALVMSITLLALNFLGDALRDALDPRARR
jgi:peptide/nickel transport system permease protein/oligopeptide transport system permease protein